MMNKKSLRQGFSVLECLIALLILSLFMPIVVQSLSLLLKSSLQDQQMQDEIAMIQLQRELLLAKNVTINNKTLSFQKLQHDFELKLVNGKLILSPGTYIFLVELEEIDFEQEGQILSIQYCRKTKCTKRPLLYL